MPRKRKPTGRPVGRPFLGEKGKTFVARARLSTKWERRFKLLLEEGQPQSEVIRDALELYWHYINEGGEL